MRTRSIFAILAVLAFLGLSAGAALAQGGGQRPDGERGSSAAQGGGASAADHDNATARREALHAARQHALAMFHENRTAALDAYHAANRETRESFLENKTRVLEECRALRNGTGYGYGTSADVATCVRDGLRPLIEQARAEHQEARETFVETLREARRAALDHFFSERARIREEYGRPGSG